MRLSMKCAATLAVPLNFVFRIVPRSFPQPKMHSIMMGICLTHHTTISGMRQWKSIHGTSICRGLVSEADTHLDHFAAGLRYAVSFVPCRPVVYGRSAPAINVLCDERRVAASAQIGDVSLRVIRLVFSGCDAVFFLL